MADESGAKGGVPTPPPASPPGIEPVVRTPLHEDPEVQDYVNRQVAKGIELALQSIGKDRTSATPDELDLIAQEVAKEFELTEKAAKSLVNKIDRVSGRKVEGLQKQFDDLNLSLRFGAVFAANPDAKSFEKKMYEIFNGLNEYERQFVLKSPEGPSFLLDKARKSVTGGILTPAQKAAGGSPPTSSVSAASKTADTSAILKKAAEALASGNRGEYQRLVTEAMR